MTTMRPSCGVDGELDVGAAGLDADLADDGERGVAHELVFLVGQRLGGGDGDGVAGVDAHGVEVLDGADDDDVVGRVAHDLHLELLPAEEALLDEDRVDGAEFEAVGDHVVEFVAVVGDAAAGAAEGEAGAEDAGEADVVSDGAGLVQVVGEAGAGALEADGVHGLLEEVAVLGLADGLGVGADHLAAVAVEGAGS